MSIPDDGLPCVEIGESRMIPDLLLQLQRAALKHPFAAQALFCALASEGEAFALTPEGQAWRDRLSGSQLLHRARAAFDLPGFSMPSRDKATTLPSNYVDALFALAGARQPGELIETLLSGGLGDA
jgi:hypothetical protein